MMAHYNDCEWYAFNCRPIHLLTNSNVGGYALNGFKTSNVDQLKKVIENVKNMQGIFISSVSLFVNEGRHKTIYCSSVPHQMQTPNPNDRLENASNASKIRDSLANAECDIHDLCVLSS